MIDMEHLTEIKFSVSCAGCGNVAWGLAAMRNVVDGEGTDSIEDIVHIAVIYTAVEVAH